jgi:endonuclease YncB( thermonuclease family)
VHKVLARAILAAGFVLAVSGPVRADFTAKVVRADDGGTITIATDREQARVRIAEIDAPDRAQPFGKASAQSLAGLCGGKTALLAGYRKDSRGRARATVRCEGIDAGSEQLRRGLAWADRQAAPKDSPLNALEAEAKAARRGLWADPAPVPPWIWRRKMCCTVSSQ